MGQCKVLAGKVGLAAVSGRGLELGPKAKQRLTRGMGWSRVRGIAGNLSAIVGRGGGRKTWCCNTGLEN